MRKMASISLLCLMCLTVACGDKPQVQPPDSPTATPAPKQNELTTVSPAQLVEEGLRDRDAVNRKYAERVVIVSGKIARSEQEPAGAAVAMSESRNWYIGFIPNPKESKGDVAAHFVAPTKQILAQLKVGNEVTVKCRYEHAAPHNEGFLIVTLINCVLQ